MRLAADSGARRGELAALRFGDLDGRVLTIERGVSGEQVGPTKTRRVRRLTLGATTVALWLDSESTWRDVWPDVRLRCVDLLPGPRSSAASDHEWVGPLVRGAVCRSGTRRRQPPPPSPYRGDLPGRPWGTAPAQQRLGHRDASTTLRNYAHALPLEDQEVADDIDSMLSGAQGE